MMVDREMKAREVFAELHPHESWEDFDSRYEARGGCYHPFQEKAFAIVDRLAALEGLTQPTP